MKKGVRFVNKLVECRKCWDTGVYPVFGSLHWGPGEFCRCSMGMNLNEMMLEDLDGG